MTKPSDFSASRARALRDFVQSTICLANDGDLTQDLARAIVRDQCGAAIANAMCFERAPALPSDPCPLLPRNEQHTLGLGHRTHWDEALRDVIAEEARRCEVLVLAPKALCAAIPTVTGARYSWDAGDPEHVTDAAPSVIVLDDFAHLTAHRTLNLDTRPLRCMLAAKSLAKDLGDATIVVDKESDVVVAQLTGVTWSRTWVASNPCIMLSSHEYRRRPAGYVRALPSGGIEILRRVCDPVYLSEAEGEKWLLLELADGSRMVAQLKLIEGRLSYKTLMGKSGLVPSGEVKNQAPLSSRWEAARADALLDLAFSFDRAYQIAMKDKAGTAEQEADLQTTAEWRLKGYERRVVFPQLAEIPF